MSTKQGKGDNDDGIAKAFSKIRPADFVRQTAHFYEHTPGPETFDVFLNRHLYAVRYAFIAADGQINPVASLSDGRVERLFAARDDDSVATMFQRLTEQAKETGSTRFFFSRTVEAIVNDETDIVRTVIWYAEDISSGEIHHGGMMITDTPDGVNLGSVVEAQKIAGVLGDLLTGVLHR